MKNNIIFKKLAIVFLIVFSISLIPVNQGQAIPFNPINTDIIVDLTDISGHFTDPVFKQAVWEWLGNSGTPGAFTAEDIETRLPEKQYLLQVAGKSISSLDGLEYFDGLKELKCYNCQLSSLPPLPDTLTWLSCSANYLSSLPALPVTLNKLYCSHNQLNSLPPLPDTLEQLSCEYNQLTALPDLPDSLRVIYCQFNYINVFEGGSFSSTIEDFAYAKTYKPQYRIVYTGEDIQLTAGETLQLDSSIIKIQSSSDGSLWEDAGNVDLSELTFSSSDNAAAKVDSAGLITAEGAGACSIYARLGTDSEFTKTAITVTVAEAAEEPEAVAQPEQPAEELEATQSDQPAEEPSATDSVPAAEFRIGSTSYKVNGELRSMDVAPYISDNRTFLPVRFVAYGCGVNESDIVWDQTTSKVQLRKGDILLELTIGNKVLISNMPLGSGSQIQMDTAPEITSDRTMLPVRWIAEQFGYEVTWDPFTQIVGLK
ncbi:MAG: stalk domain-containing protein [Syntrophomonadaceae bacterium]|nr:stalk domain-containing protein [Syntrophomonadaceae bacterium]